MPERHPNNAPKPAEVTGQEIRDAARAVASHCLLPDPRSTGTKLQDTVTTFWRPMHFESLEQCAKYEIKGTTHGVINTNNNTVIDRAAFDEIMTQAGRLAVQGAKQCQVRDFNDSTVVPRPYYGYRGADNQCHVTHDEKTAQAARCAYDQYQKSPSERLFLPRAPLRADAQGKCMR